MQEITLTVNNKTGLHARPAALLVQAASRFTSEITVLNSEGQVNAKSIMGIMALGASFGTKLTIKAVGADEVKAVEAIKELFDNNFGE